MQKAFNPKWDLDSIFEGGSTSLEFKRYIEDIKKEMKSLSVQLEEFQPNEKNVDEKLVKIIDALENIMTKVRQAGAFVSCLSAQDVNDAEAEILVGDRSALGAEFSGIMTTFRDKIVSIPEEEWNQLLQNENLKELTYILNEYRTNAQDLLPKEQEVLISDLAVNGYHAWNQMYSTLVGTMKVELEEDGEVNTYSIGQASNKLSSPNREFRKYVYEKLDAAWSEQAPLFAQTLNNLAGFRIQTYKHRKWDNILQEPLTINRMQQGTLDAMWRAITNNKHHFVKYLNKKAELLGLEKLSVYDVNAPVSKTEQKSSYTDGANFIIEHFRAFSPKMADFSQQAFENRWIEAEDRPGKRPGGFCTSFPDSKETRIFMTYSGTASNISTLAHELGHAYHQHVMNDLHGLNQRYAMNVAETASTFAEMIVADAAVNNASSKEEKLAMLEDKVSRSVAFFMNIHARFIFELNFYKERENGFVSVNRLNELMIDAQKEAYQDALADYDENFWSSKLHFHITGVPFYNFPYTFGYLFSLGIYAYAKKQGGSFEDDYIALLQDTGRMTVEDLAMKHLNADLTKPDFWEDAIALCVEDVEEFLSL
ncbi:M3 family oligoendopeptidase [Oceanobacillus sp. CAU 1775]